MYNKLIKVTRKINNHETTLQDIINYGFDNPEKTIEVNGGIFEEVVFSHLSRSESITREVLK